jgi:hypothetical protein
VFRWGARIFEFPGHLKGGGATEYTVSSSFIFLSFLPWPFLSFSSTQRGPAPSSLVSGRDGPPLLVCKPDKMGELRLAYAQTTYGAKASLGGKDDKNGGGMNGLCIGDDWAS